MTEPLSANNPKIKRLARLIRDRKARRDQGAFVVEGPRAIETFLACGDRARVEAVFTDNVERFEGGLGASVPVHLVERRLLDRICDSETPQGVVAVAEMAKLSLAAVEGVDLAVVLDGVQDPGNVGAIVRVAAAMGAQCVICVRGCADPFSPKAVRASAGTIGAISIVPDVDATELISAISEFGFTPVGATMSDGTDLDAIEVDGPIALFLGAEGAGLSDSFLDVLDECITIAMSPPVESLNVAVTAGIVLYGLRRALDKS